MCFKIHNHFCYFFKIKNNLLKFGNFYLMIKYNSVNENSNAQYLEIRQKFQKISLFKMLNKTIILNVNQEKDKIINH
jgi:hypothetical protein